jgi:hypothetical protein
MKKFISFLTFVSIIAMFAFAFVPATINNVSHGMVYSNEDSTASFPSITSPVTGQWMFKDVYIGRVKTSDTLNPYQSFSRVSWTLIDVNTGRVIRPRVFVHRGSEFNTWFDNFNDFHYLYLELQAAENLPPLDSTINNIIYN